MGIIWTILIGFVAGLVARAVLPGNQPMGFILTVVLGIAGSLLATYLGQAMGWYTAGAGAGFIANQILGSLGPTAFSGIAGGALGRMLAPGQSQLTPDQASRLSPDQVSDIAAHAEKSQPGVIDQVGQFHAQHAGLIKMLAARPWR